MRGELIVVVFKFIYSASAPLDQVFDDVHFEFDEIQNIHPVQFFLRLLDYLFLLWTLVCKNHVQL